MSKRVVVTGIGAVTPVGNDAPSTWQALLAGQSGVDYITSFDTEAYDVKFAGEVKNFKASDYIDRKEARRMDRCSHFSIVAAREAVQDANLSIDEQNADQVGIIIGSAVGGISTLLEQKQVFEKRGARRLSPFFLPNMLVDSPSGQVAIDLGARGPNMAVVSACATGGGAVGEAMETIKRGDAEVMIAGGTEAPLLPLILAGFIQMRALANHEDPTKASRPFDVDRSGFVISEGAAILILESLEHARSRGATIYAEVGGYAASNDAHHMAAPREGGVGPAQTISRALEKSGIQPESVDYVNAHGTGTPINDAYETSALKHAFGSHADQLMISSTKSMTGHFMGASGAVEAMVCALALHDQVIPPTINLENPDPECDLDYTPLKKREAEIHTAISNSIGLGGHNSCVVLRRYLEA